MNDTCIACANCFARGVDHFLSSPRLGAVTDMTLCCEAMLMHGRCTHLEDALSLWRADRVANNRMVTVSPEWHLGIEKCPHRRNTTHPMGYWRSAPSVAETCGHLGY